jgi:hypothetical protein
MLADRGGKVLFGTTSLLEREVPKINPLLTELFREPIESRAVKPEGTIYMPATLQRSGESERPKKCDRFPSLACGTDGRVCVVFTTNRNGNSDVFLRVFDGTKWADDRPVAATEADEYDGTVLISHDGEIWLSWTSNSAEGNYNISAARLSDPSAPIKSEQITHANDDAMHARMAHGKDGNLWITYYKWHKMGRYSRDKEVYARRYDGREWSQEIRVSPTDVPTYEDHSDPAIAAFRHGAMVAWSWDYHRPRGYPQTASEPTVFVRSIGNDLRLDRPQVVSGHYIDTTPTTAVDGSGQVWCAWDHLGRNPVSGAYRKELHVRRFDPASGSSSSTPHQQSAGLYNLCTPCFAVSPEGMVTLVWAETKDGEQWSLRKADFNPNEAGWPESETLVSEANPRFPSAAYDSKGNLWIAYSAETVAGREIRIKKLIQGQSVMNSVHPETVEMYPASWEGQHAAPPRYQDTKRGTTRHANLGLLVPLWCAPPRAALAAWRLFSGQ